MAAAPTPRRKLSFEERLELRRLRSERILAILEERRREILPALGPDDIPCVCGCGRAAGKPMGVQRKYATRFCRERVYRDKNWPKWDFPVRTCAAEGCAATFTASRNAHCYCSAQCKDRQKKRDSRARKRLSEMKEAAC